MAQFVKCGNKFQGVAHCFMVNSTQDQTLTDTYQFASHSFAPEANMVQPQIAESLMHLNADAAAVECRRGDSGAREPAENGWRRDLISP